MQSPEARLQARKSAHEAWRCVSLGCSLLVMVMLASRCHQTGTDLNLLLGIGRLLRAADEPPSTSANNASSSLLLTWPPVPIELLLPAQNESSLHLASMDSVASNESMLMSHLHVSLGRQLTGDQLLRQEVDSFVAEFQAARSTLWLSSALVAVYILSWLLMSLALSEGRVSNDISLRNILLLCVFGAVDLAASFGFVMVRLVMYSVKNNSFVSGMLAFDGLRNSSVRLSSDQLAAFTALRLIGMRSCSAHTDLYVSVLVLLLTCLRLWSALKALRYYQLLKRLVKVAERGAPTKQLAQPLATHLWPPVFQQVVPEDLRLSPDADTGAHQHRHRRRAGQRSASLEDALRRKRGASSGVVEPRRHSAVRNDEPSSTNHTAADSSNSARTSQLYLLAAAEKGATSGGTQNRKRTAAKRAPDLLLVGPSAERRGRAGRTSSRSQLEELVCGPAEGLSLPRGVVSSERPGSLSYTLLEPSQVREARRAGRLFVAAAGRQATTASSEPETGGAQAKYRLVAATRYQRGPNEAASSRKATPGAVASESPSTTSSASDSSSSGSSSSSSTSVSDSRSNARLHRAGWQDPAAAGLRHTEELVGHKVYQVLSKTPGSLLRKYYYT